MFVIFLLQRRRQPGMFAACLAVTLTAAGVSVVCFVLGLIVSFAAAAPTGACIVLVNLAAYVLASFAARILKKE